MAHTSTVTALIVALFATRIFSVSGAIIGQLYCSTCGAGPYDALLDVYLPNVQVSVTCTVTNPGNSMQIATFTGHATTNDSGIFVAPFSGGSYPVISVAASLDQTLNAYLFANGLLGSGLLPGAGVVGCQVMASGTPCSVIAYNNGVCAGGNVTAGDGNSGTNVALSKNGLKTDLVLGGAGQLSTSIAPTICLTYPTKSANCSSPPPSPPSPPPGVKGDPHFSGADGSHFDFTGRPNATYCLVTDAHLHVNAFYGGRYAPDSSATDGEGASNAMTWIRRVGILWGHHTIQLAAREGARWEYDNGYMASIEVDGETVALTQPGDTLWFPATSHKNRLGKDDVSDNRMAITWVAAKEKSGDDLVDVYEVQVGSVMTMRITLRPEVAFLRIPECGMVHMSLEWPFLDVSGSVHGVLGQTYRPDFKGRLAKHALRYSDLLDTEVVSGSNAEGFLDGDVDSYMSSSLMRPDCAESRFARANEVDFETAKAREMSITIAKTITKVSRKIWVNV